MRAQINADMLERVEILRSHRDKLWAELDAASNAFKAIDGVGSGQMGLTPDAVKFGPEFQAASRRYQVAHKALRTFSTINRKMLPMLRTPRGA